MDPVKNIFIYPNPADDRIRFSNADGIEKIKILSISGAEILEQIFSKQDPVSAINTKSLANGIYFVIVSVKEYDHTHKLIIQH